MQPPNYPIAKIQRYKLSKTYDWSSKSINILGNKIYPMVFQSALKAHSQYKFETLSLSFSCISIYLELHGRSDPLKLTPQPSALIKSIKNKASILLNDVYIIID
jgi:hypothetical protein